jgi:hypothetical protein
MPTSLFYSKLLRSGGEIYKAFIQGNHSIGVLIGKNNWSAFGVVKSFWGLESFWKNWGTLGLQAIEGHC